MIKVGVISGDRWHSTDTVLSGLRSALGMDDHIQVTFLTSSADWSRAWMDEKDVIVLAKINHVSETDESPWLTSDIKRSIKEYVEQGGGLAVIHAGTVGYGNDTDFQSFLGAVFHHHPEPCEVKLTITPSAAPFEIKVSEDIVVYDEHYIMEMSDEPLHIFMASTSEHGTQAAGWTKRHGAGKVCVMTPGHYLDVWLQPDYGQLIKKAIEWCSDQGNLEAGI